MKIGLIFPKRQCALDFYLTHNTKLIDFLKSTQYPAKILSNSVGIIPALPVIAALTPPDYDIEIIDENQEEIDFTKNYDLIGITCFTLQAARAYEVADTFRAKGVKVVLGGIHPTLLPDEAKGHADSVLIGEAENIWKELLKDFENKRLKPFYKSGQPVDLKDSPIPRYDLLQNKNYKILFIQTTRGCPHDCDFCAATNIYGRRYRRKPIERTVEEIKYIQKYFGNKKIGFCDDNMLVDKKYAKKLLKAITPFNFYWWGMTDISVGEDDELLRLLRESGCTALFIGLESVSEKSLETIDRNGWKAKRVKYYAEYIQRIQSYGIGVIGGFIIGLEMDDSSIFQKITDFSIENSLYDITVAINTPYPGTRLYERLLGENRLLPLNWEYYNSADVTFRHKYLSKEEIEEGQYRIMKSFYNRDVYLRRLRYFNDIQKRLFKKNPFTR